MKSREKPEALKPYLGLWSAVAINIGTIIGGGIFVVTGIVAGSAGSALVIAMLVAAVIAAFTALSFAELTAWQPVEGSVYEYARQLVSPFSGFLTGWMWIISNTFGGAAVALGFAYYFTAAIPGLPVNVVAALLCVLFTVINFVGIRQSALFNNVLVAVKLVILGFFVAFGLLHVNSANFMPFVPFNVGVLYGAYFIFFAYAGFARAAVVAEEIKDAKRTVPRAVLLSLAISAVVYVLVGIVAVGLVGAVELGRSLSPLTDAIGATGSSLAMQIVSFGGLVATASVLLTSVLGVSRMAFAMARRKDMPQALSKLHGKFGTPYYSIWIAGIAMALLVLFVDLTQVVAVSIFAILFYYAITNLAAFRLKNGNRRYHKLVHLVGLITCLVLLAFSVFASTQAWIIGVACLVAGAVVYGVKGYISKRKSL
jgi:APA family basic amino acid/polyamine antiporter